MRICSTLEDSPNIDQLDRFNRPGSFLRIAGYDGLIRQAIPCNNHLGHRVSSTDRHPSALPGENMNVWAISDLHLSFARPDRREVLAARWRDHAELIKNEWLKVIHPTDYVLIPGDISMAKNHRELQADLDWIGQLPGTKIFSAGNHDRWWGRVETVRKMMRRSMRALDGDAFVERGIVCCGAKGAPVPDSRNVTSSEGIAIEATLRETRKMLEHAVSLRASETPLFVLWHYPPFDRHGHPGPWVECFEEFKVTACVYGHLHAERQWSATVQGALGSVRYYCVAADAIGFRPLKIHGEL